MNSVGAGWMPCRALFFFVLLSFCIVVLGREESPGGSKVRPSLPSHEGRRCCYEIYPVPV